jgi:alkylation response protein AidB-like acyl-CoA dehydrogenase
MSDTGELTLDTLRASIGSVNGIATTAYDIASNASLSVQDAQHKIALLETQVMILKLQVDNLVKSAEARALQSQTAASAANNTAAAALQRVVEQSKQIHALQVQADELAAAIRTWSASRR